MTERDSENLTVLIVEDSEDSRYFMRLELEQLGYLVTEAEDGAKAVEIALRERPDVILMDLTLPVMDGLAATAMIRNNEQMSKALIIAITAHQQTELRAQAKASGFDAYVTKPFEIPWLDELIKGLLVCSPTSGLPVSNYKPPTLMVTDAPVIEIRDIRKISELSALEDLQKALAKLI